MKTKKLNLFLFDGEGTAPAGNGAAENAEHGDAAGHEPKVLYGRQPEAPAEDKPEPRPYEDIKREYKEDFQKDIDRIISKRFKNSKSVEAERDSLKQQLASLTGALSPRYGTEKFDELLEAIGSDESYIEAKALEKGQTAEEYKANLKADRLQAELNRRDEQAQQAQQIEAWEKEAVELKALYPEFSLETEADNETFARFLQSGMSMKEAYQAAHFDEILSGAIRYTADAVKSTVARAKAERMARPAENGARSGAAAIVKNDVSKLSKADQEEIDRRVLRGEKIRF